MCVTDQFHHLYYFCVGRDLTIIYILLYLGSKSKINRKIRISANNIQSI